MKRIVMLCCVFLTLTAAVRAQADKGRDAPSLSDARELTRNLPQQHGGEVASDPGAEGGLRGAREQSDADLRGGRKRN